MPEADGRWRRIEDIYHAAVEYASVERESFLRDACGIDDGMKAEVQSLLEHSGSALILDEDALELGARLISRTVGSLAGESLGPYRLLSLIGAGGMGEVYLAEDTRLAREVAVKVLPRLFSADPLRKQQFAREARAASALTHPNIVAIHDVGEAGGSAFLVMEYVRGDTLAALLASGPIPLDESVRYAVQMAAALEAAHAAGVVHRDLKPGNVMVTPGGLVKVLDFSLAKITHGALEPRNITAPTTIAGTVAYMSPEQARGRPVDEQSDIFTFGAVLYEMLTGVRAFAGDSTVSTLAAVLIEDPIPVRSLVRCVPPDLQKVLSKCLAKAPAQRWSTMAEVRSALEAVLSGQARHGGTNHRHALRVAAGIIAAVALAGFVRVTCTRGRCTERPDRCPTRNSETEL